MDMSLSIYKTYEQCKSIDECKDLFLDIAELNQINYSSRKEQLERKYCKEELK